MKLSLTQPKTIIPIIQRFTLLLVCLLCLLPTFLLAEQWRPALAEPKHQPEITVYRDPYCGCCHNWMTYLQQSGFQVKEVETDNMEAIKQRYSVPSDLSSCHTAIVDQYVVEGHVPATEIQRLLKEKLNVVGITVPQMPVGSPGMEMEGRKDPFSVLSFDRAGQTQVLQSYQ